MSARAAGHRNDPLDEARRRGYEPRDVPPRGVIYSVLGLFLGIGCAGLVVAGVLALSSAVRERLPATALEAASRIPPEPRLEVSPQERGTAVRRAAKQQIEGYAWVDRSAGTVRIPIERAMQILAVEGWPDARREKGGTR